MENQRSRNAVPPVGNVPNPAQYPINNNANANARYQQPINSNANANAQYQQPIYNNVNGQARYVPHATPYMNQFTGAPPVQAVVRQKLPRRKRTTRDLIMAILTGLMCFIMIDSSIWTGTLGIGFAIGAFIFLAVEVWYLVPDIKRKSAYGIICILLIAAGCVSLVFSADHFLKMLTLICLMILTTCFMMESMELRVWENGTFRSLGDYFYTAYAASFGKIAAGMYGLFHSETKENGKQKSGFGKAMLGLAIALPVVLILIYLLYNGDDAFRGMLNSINFKRFPQKPLSALLAVPLFILLFSRLFSLKDINRKQKEESDRGLDPTVLTFFLIGISVVYLLYLFSQLSYFFNGFLGFLPENFTYAQYARRGFFELAIVSSINIITVMMCIAFCRKKEGKLPISVKLTLLFLCCFSLVLVLTEVAKMKMYMDTFGLTRLRILTTLFTVLLAVVFLSLIVRLFVKKTPYLKVAVVAGTAMLIFLCFINIDGVIARYNVQAFRDGTLKTIIDVQTITKLDDAAVPSLIELASDDDPEIAQAAADNLYLRWKKLHKPGEWDWDAGEQKAGELKDYNWIGFNLTSYKARKLLLENESLILSLHQNNLTLPKTDKSVFS